MQLASQRPNPPPVPPRPSRQVVAEALKRTTRPPCPTRQAPPPPNTRPWRYQDHEKTPVPQVGRTVVYESGKEQHTNVEQTRCSSEPRSPNELQRSLTSRRCSNDENGINIAGNDVFVEKTEKTNGEGSCSNRATSERNEAENHQQPIRRRSNGNVRSDRENFSSQLNETDNENSIKANDDVSLTHKETDSYSDRTCLHERNKASDAINEKFNVLNDESLKITDKEDKRLLDDDANEKIAKLVEVEITGNHNHDGRSYQKRSSSFGKEDYFKGEAAGKRQSLTPTKIQEKTQANVNNDGDKVIGNSYADEEITCDAAEEEEASTTNASGSTMTISSDDCATVVVIDETERKIAIIEDNDNIQHQDWLEAGIRYSSTKITLPGDDPVDIEFTRHNDKSHNGDDEEYDDKGRLCDRIDHTSIRERIAMSSLQGLPPLPRSLSGFNLSEGRRETAEPPPPPARSSSKTQKNVKSTQPSSSRPSPPGRQLTTLDTQLAILRKEMFGLRQLDLSLLSQLWSLNESIQEFRQLLQEQEDRAPSPSPSSEEGDDNSYGNHPPPPPRRPAPLLHHHRPPRPPRPLRPPASDESPSSEEYGAV